MDTLPFGLAVLGYIAAWCGIFGPLAGLVRMVGRVSPDRAKEIASAACYIGAVLAVLAPLLVAAANNPALRFPTGEVLDALHERCPARWCSPLLTVVEQPE